MDPNLSYHIGATLTMTFPFLLASIKSLMCYYHAIKKIEKESDPDPSVKRAMFYLWITISFVLYLLLGATLAGLSLNATSDAWLGCYSATTGLQIIYVMYVLSMIKTDD